MTETVAEAEGHRPTVVAVWREATEAHARRATFHRLPRLLRAELGDQAGCLGAAFLALDPAGGAS